MEKNNTRRQHYLSRVEQRLNACNPAANPTNQRIFEFDIVDRDSHTVRLTDPRGRSIESTLSLFDLFSFDRDDTGLRANFEREFNRYENLIASCTNAILEAHSTKTLPHSDDLYRLFLAKLVNFARNPYCIQKTLNTFRPFAEHYPLDAKLLQRFMRVAEGNRPQQEFLCKKLLVTGEEYNTWLRVLFMMLTPMAGGENTFLDEAIKQLFEARDATTFVQVHCYDEAICLLSDRGFSSPFVHEKHMSFDFNLSSHAFIRFSFMVHEEVMRGKMPPDLMQRLLGKQPPSLKLAHSTNDFDALKLFNFRVIEQAFNKVYSAGKNPHAVSVEIPQTA